MFANNSSMKHGWSNRLAVLFALLVPVAYVWLYSPYGMDTTDFGYFYGYPWRILQGEMPYRDFYYINPAFPLFWHAFWLKITPQSLGILGGKIGFVVAMLGASWFGVLFLNRVFALERIGISIPLLSTTAFVWGVHTFAHMPWHTVDGIFFATGAIYAAAVGMPFVAGLLCGFSFLSKQSFLLLPPALLLSIYFLRPHKRETLMVLAAFLLVTGLWWGFLQVTGSWEMFRTFTSKPLDIHEALEAGIYIYLRQEWWLPALALIPFFIWKRVYGLEPIPAFLQPVPLYVVILAARYIQEVGATQTWIGFGESWPTLGVFLGGLAVLFPAMMLQPWLRDQCTPKPLLRASLAMALVLLISWSAGISGGYKTPALFAVPLIFTFLLVQTKLGGKASVACWTFLLMGLLMFRIGYEFPYTFPVRSMAKENLTYNAGEIFPKASGVYVDKYMYETLRELKQLREKYGPNYRVLPAFPHAYYLTNDKPAFPSEWLMDYLIVGRIDEMYQLLVQKDITVFMLRDQMNTVQADGYARAGYAVPQMVRKRWRVLETTEHFVVMRAPIKSIKRQEVVQEKQQVLSDEEVLDWKKSRERKRVETHEDIDD